jgi:hypothetical protein
MPDLEYLGKIATKTYKQLEHERLLNDKVTSASELSSRKEEEARRAQEFTRAAADEEFVNRTEKSVSLDCPTPIGQRAGVVTREPFEEQP